MACWCSAPLIGGFIPIFSLIRRIKFAENGLDYSLMNTTRQALFLPVDRDSKYDGKTAIDTFFWRFGDLIQAVGIYVGLHVLDWKSHEFAVLTFLLALVWIWLAVLMGRNFSRKSHENLVNVPPAAVEPIPDLLYSPGVSFMHPISPMAFYDAEPGDVLKLRACCDDGSHLPHWMHFDVRAAAFCRQGAGACRDHGTAHHRHCHQPGWPGGAQHFRGQTQDYLYLIRRAAAPVQGGFAVAAAAGRASNESRRWMMALSSRALSRSPSADCKFGSSSAFRRRRISAPGAGGCAFR